MIEPDRRVEAGSLQQALDLTPSADVVSQSVIAAPMIVLYIISIGVAWLFAKKRTAER